MGFAMFSAQFSPIAIDFGSASVKLLQISTAERPALLSAAEVPVPDSIRGDADRLLAFYAEWLPKTLKEGRFKGKRAVISIPASQTFTQHMQVSEADGLGRDEAVKLQLQAQMGYSPQGVVVRALEVCPVVRNNQTRTETICFAIARETVMKYVELLKKCKLEVVGVHTDTLAMVRAFDHISRRETDVNVTTLFVDMGWGGTRVAVTHGKRLMFTRYIQVGGKHFDQHIAGVAHCDMHAARAHRLSLRTGMVQSDQAAAIRAEAPQGMAILNAAMARAGAAKDAATSGSLPAAVAEERRVGARPSSLGPAFMPLEAQQLGVDLKELLDTMTDELSMCLRYHQGLFRDRPIDRAVFVGGESRQAWLCQHLVKSLRVPAQMGDPLARLDVSQSPTLVGLSLGQPQPGWSVACGLCTSPTDL